MTDENGCAKHGWRRTQIGAGCPYCQASDGGAFLMAQRPEVTWDGITAMTPEQIDATPRSAILRAMSRLPVRPPVVYAGSDGVYQDGEKISTSIHSTRGGRAMTDDEIEAVVAQASAELPPDERTDPLKILERALPLAGYRPKGMGETPVVPAELRPPPEHADKPGLHWLRIDHGNGDVRTKPAGWELGGGGFWCLLGVGRAMSPAEVAGLGWRYLGPADWRDPAPIDQLVENWPPHAMAERIVKDAPRIAELEAAMKHMQVVTPGMWCDADVVAMKVQIAELEAKLRGTEGAMGILCKSYRGEIRDLRRALDADLPRLSSAWEDQPCITTGATVPRPAGRFPAQALRGGAPR